MERSLANLWINLRLLFPAHLTSWWCKVPNKNWSVDAYGKLADYCGQKKPIGF